MSTSAARGIGTSLAVVLSASVLAGTAWSSQADASGVTTPSPTVSASSSALAPSPSATDIASSTPTPTPSPSVSTVAVVAPAAAPPAKVVTVTKARVVGLVIPYRFGTKKYSQFFARAYMAHRYHWGRTAYLCLVRLWERESHWNRHSHSRSGAHGIPQALPGKKMARIGKDWRTNPKTQIRWGLAYIKSKYGNPIRAWRFWRSHHWY